MKVLTILGTRPEIIRLSAVIELLDRECEHTLAFTGQNSAPSLSTIFFEELGVRPPDLDFSAASPNFPDQLALILKGASQAIDSCRPDRVLILGDTNSGLAAIVAARRGVPVYHMEAGNRCYDDRVPEEVNRRIIDHCSAVLLPYTHRSKDNLVREGISRHRIFVTGNPIGEVINRHHEAIQRSRALEEHGLIQGGFALATLHRAENVDIVPRLAGFLEGFSRVAERLEMPLVVSVHPRTEARIAQAGINPRSPRVRLVKPLGFFDFIALEKAARIVLSDSGTVQEECAILHIPSVTLRDVTERPETIECGSSVLSGAEPGNIEAAARLALGRTADWIAPPEYLESHVARTVANIVLGHQIISRG